MVERAEREPTMDEIVVALRETRRGDARGRHLALVGASGDAAGAARDGCDVAELRDGEIRRLLDENARLNDRVVSLLKIIERDQAQIAALTADSVRSDKVMPDLRAAIEAELRPVMLALLRGLEARGGTARPRTGWIVDLDAAPISHTSDQETRP